MLPWLCEHHVAVAASWCSFAVFAPDSLDQQCSWLVGELFGGMLAAYRRNADSAVTRSTTASGVFETSASIEASDPVEASSPVELTEATARVKTSGPLEVRAPVEHTTDHECGFAAHQFASTFLPCIALGSWIIVWAAGSYAGDRNVRRTAALVVVVPVIGVLSLRIWLHQLQDQQRALVLFGRGCVVVVGCQAVVVHITFQDGLAADELRTSAVFLCNRFILLFVILYMGYAAVDSAHRWLTCAIFVGGAITFPTLSEVGRPLEPIVTSAGVLLGELVASLVQATLRRTFVQQQSQRRRVQLAKQALQQAKATQEQRERDIEHDFLAMTCHEVRNPLNGVVGHLRLASLLLEQRANKPDRKSVV